MPSKSLASKLHLPNLGIMSIFGFKPRANDSFRKVTVTFTPRSMKALRRVRTKAGLLNDTAALSLAASVVDNIIEANEQGYTLFLYKENAEPIPINIENLELEKE